jgi:hypothetical protein
MGKSIRSKREKRLRSQRRELAQVNFYDKKDAEVQAKLAAILTEQTVEPREPSAVQMGETVFLIVVFKLRFLLHRRGYTAQLVEHLFWPLWLHPFPRSLCLLLEGARVCHCLVYARAES